MNIAPPEADEVLAIAKKYYDRHSDALQDSLKDELSDKAGGVNFDGSLKDDDKAEQLCAAATAMLDGDDDLAIACAAAAVGWSKGYARSAGAMAAVIAKTRGGNGLTEIPNMADAAASPAEMDPVDLQEMMEELPEPQNIEDMMGTMLGKMADIMGAAMAAAMGQMMAEMANAVQRDIAAGLDWPSDARKLAEYAVSLDKNDAELYTTLAEILFVLNDPDGALEAADAALAIEQDNSTALLLKAGIHASKGKTVAPPRIE